MPIVSADMSEILDVVKTVSMMVLIFGVFAFFVRAMNSHVQNIIVHMEAINEQFKQANGKVTTDMRRLDWDVRHHMKNSDEFKAVIGKRIDDISRRVK